MKIVQLEQGSQDWLNWRNQGVSATESAILIGESPYKTPRQLWEEKLGITAPEDLSNNPNVRRGNRLEDKARQKYEELSQDIVLPVCVEYDHNNRIRASLDGLTSAGEPAELKCPADSTFEKVRAEGEESQAYKLYWWQVQHQMLVCESDRGFLLFYREFTNEQGEVESEHILFEIEKDEAAHNQIIEASEDFCELLDSRKAPEPVDGDFYQPTGESAKAFSRAASNYIALADQEAELKAQLEAIKSSMKEHSAEMESLMGDYTKAEFAGVLVSKFVVDGRVNYKKLIENESSISELVTPEMEAQYRGKASQRSRVTVTGNDVHRLNLDDEKLKAAEDVKNPQTGYF